MYLPLDSYLRTCHFLNLPLRRALSSDVIIKVTIPNQAKLLGRAGTRHDFIIIPLLKPRRSQRLLTIFTSHIGAQALLAG